MLYKYGFLHSIVYFFHDPRHCAHVHLQVVEPFTEITRWINQGGFNNFTKGGFNNFNLLWLEKVWIDYGQSIKSLQKEVVFFTQLALTNSAYAFKSKCAFECPTHWMGRVWIHHYVGIPSLISACWWNWTLLS